MSFELEPTSNRHGSRRRAAIVRSMSPDQSDIAEDKLSGVHEIAEFIGETERRTFYLLDRKLIPAGKLGSLWIASRKVLRAHYERLTAAE